MDEQVSEPRAIPGARPALPLLVFTDLDGTLLDHDDYSFTAAQAALQRLRRLRIPLVAVTSKTLAEVRALQQALDNRHPCIVENGSAICIPAGYFDGRQPSSGEDAYQVIRLCPDYRHVTALLQDLRARHGFRFQGFHDMSAEQLAEDTGLTLADAQRARKRLCSEPLRWDDSASALERFAGALRAAGLQLTRGGRYWHVLGGSDKADAMTALIRMYRARGHRRFITVALGDSANDESMLDAADIAVAIRRKDGGILQLPAHDRMLISNLPGPHGWNAAVQQLLALLDPAGAGGRAPAPQERACV